MARLETLPTGKVLGYQVRTPEGEKIGQVEEIVVDAEMGRLAYGILSFKEFFGTDERLFAIPWRALTLGSDGKTLVLNVSQDTLRGAPWFHREEWPDVTDPEWGSQIYWYYDREPYWKAEPTEIVRERYPEMARSRRRSRASSGAGWLVALLLLLAVAGIVAYVLYPRETEVAAETIGREAERAAIAVKERSEDVSTTVKVKTALALSKQLSAFDIGVDTENGVVTLEGEVPTERIKRMAAAIAEDTSGVNAVMNRLVLDSTEEALADEEQLGHRVADVETRVMVREALHEDDVLVRQPIRVDVQNGVVILSGQVEDGQQRAVAEAIARAVPGVREVVNEIRTSETTE